MCVPRQDLKTEFGDDDWFQHDGAVIDLEEREEEDSYLPICCFYNSHLRRLLLILSDVT
jgi:hypothetical protein